MFKITCRQAGRQYIVGRRTRYPFIVALKDLKIENPASKALLYFQPLAGFTLSKNADKEKSIVYFGYIFLVYLMWIFFHVFFLFQVRTQPQCKQEHRIECNPQLHYFGYFCCSPVLSTSFIVPISRLPAAAVALYS